MVKMMPSQSRAGSYIKAMTELVLQQVSDTLKFLSFGWIVVRPASELLRARVKELQVTTKLGCAFVCGWLVGNGLATSNKLE
jgi:hypothetical protein